MNSGPESGGPLGAALPTRQSRLHYSFLKLSLPLHLHNEDDDAYGSTVINGRGSDSETSLELPSEDGDVDSPSSDSGCCNGTDGGDGSESDGLGKSLDDGPLPDSGVPQLRQPIQRNHARRESLSSLLATLGPGIDFGEDDDGLSPQQRREQAQIDRASEAVRAALVSKGLLDAKLCGARIPAHCLHRQYQHWRSHNHQVAAGLGLPSWHIHSLLHAKSHATPHVPAGPSRSSVSQLDCTPRSSSPVFAELVAGDGNGAGGMCAGGAVKGGSSLTASHVSHAHSLTHTAASAPNSPMAAAALRRRQLMQAARRSGGGGANRAAVHHLGSSTAERQRSTWRRNSIAGTDTGASLAASTSDDLNGARGHGGGGGISALTGSVTTPMPLMCGAELLCPGARTGERPGGGTSDWEEELWEDSSDGVVDLGTLVRGERRRLANVRSKVTDTLRSQRRHQGLLASRPADPSAALTLTAEELTASVIPTPARPPAGVELKVPPDDIRFSGVKLRFLMGLLEALEQQPGLCGSTSELVSRLVVPLTAEHRCRLLDLIPPELRGQPHHYICHAWTCSARELLQTLRREMLPTPPPPSPPASPQPHAAISNPRSATAGPGSGKALAKEAAGAGSGTARAPAASGLGPKGSGGGIGSRDAGLVIASAAPTAAARNVAGAAGSPDMSHRVGRYGEQLDRAQYPGRVSGGLAPGAHLPQLPVLPPASALAPVPAPAAAPPGVRRPSTAAFEDTVALREGADAGTGSGTEAAAVAGRSAFLPSIAAAAGGSGGSGGSAGCCGPRGVSTPGGTPATAAAGQSWAGGEAGEGGWEQQLRSQEAWKRLHESYKEDLELALDQVVWIDLVCNNQHSAVKKDYGKIARTVVSCGATVLVLDPELTALDRTWCLFEMMHCLRCKRHLKVFRTELPTRKQQQPPARAPMSPARGHRQTGTPRGKAMAAVQPAVGDGASWGGGCGVNGHDKGARKALVGDVAAAAGSDAGAVPAAPRVGVCGFANECDRRWDRAVESISIVDSRASCEADRVGILQEVLSSVGTAYVDQVVRAALRLSNSERARQLALRREQLRTTLDLLQPDPAIIGTEEYEGNLARCREHLTSILQQHYPEDLLRCIIPGDYVSDSARCWDMLCIFAQVLDREQFREDAKVLRNMAWLIFKRHSKRYIDVLYEKELENWLIGSLEHDRKWRRTQAKLKHDAQKKWN